ncbi:uncharacterized protein [Bos mutus]|uniref:uncharacterized protein isoform X3 n=1 Tax=Bos mutus TaxID=72004 RepID=UPI0038B613F6
MRNCSLNVLDRAQNCLSQPDAVAIDSKKVNVCLKFARQLHHPARCCSVTIQVTQSVPLQARLLMWLLPAYPLYCLGKRAGTSAADRWDSHRMIPRWPKQLCFPGVGTWNLSSPAMDRTCFPCIGRHRLNHWTTRKSHQYNFDIFKKEGHLEWELLDSLPAWNDLPPADPTLSFRLRKHQCKLL